jgi:hypothetical protein
VWRQVVEQEDLKVIFHIVHHYIANFNEDYVYDDYVMRTSI